MKEIKYLMLPNDEPVIFPDYIGHDDMALKLGEVKPISGGFVQFMCNPTDHTEILITCYGESTSLGLKSTERDTKIIQRMFKDWY